MRPPHASMELVGRDSIPPPIVTPPRDPRPADCEEPIEEPLDGSAVRAAVARGQARLHGHRAQHARALHRGQRGGLLARVYGAAQTVLVSRARRAGAHPQRPWRKRRTARDLGRRPARLAGAQPVVLGARLLLRLEHPIDRQRRRPVGVPRLGDAGVLPRPGRRTAARQDLSPRRTSRAATCSRWS